ncbi:phosphotransferase enzyme family protein [Nocardioides sp. zg-1228]|uniref:phosphotransferase enzyme family protein n=1 Tax=Nocardioides sp. zg-1228 TaxID=2763008 RepID=UPI0016424616|nr:phosphotransferase [Nocardioides sp. zg-1228]MBC2933602.1 phosphotransferase [Nocardioides sp. zg-1228]QSF56271.1 phosphotransferase [Nocardioides sp. zg-1228]
MDRLVAHRPQQRHGRPVVTGRRGTSPSDLLETFWGMSGAAVTSLGGGMNSETWLVEHEGSTYVAKAVSRAAAADLATGGEVATTLARSGFVTGHPVPTRDGRMILTDPPLALLRHVPGRELDGEADEEQEWIASTLAGVHAASDPAPGPSPAAFATDWLDPRMPGVTAHPWLVAAIEAVRAETDALTVTWATLHTDPAPEAFLHDDRSGVTGLVDWAGARRGPVLYDVASAVMYLGGREHASRFLRTYLASGPLRAEEMRHLDAFSRFREAVQGVYFAGRLASDDRTGGVDRADNEKGLTDARRRLAALGVAT